MRYDRSFALVVVVFSSFLISTSYGQGPSPGGNPRQHHPGHETAKELPTIPPATSDRPAIATQGADDGSKASLESRLFLERRLMRLEEQLDSTKTAGWVLSLVVAFLGLLNILKEWRQRKDYKEERSFYEKRVLSAESRQESAAKKDEDVLSKQIDNIQKLGGVIGLLRETYELQLKRENEQAELVKKLAATDELVNQMRNDSRDRYRDAGKILLDSFAAVKAMAWPSLSPDLVNLANRARAQLESTPRFIIDEEKKADPARFARVMQLAGTSAFYANDVDAALRDLKEADDTFDSIKTGADYKNPRAYTKHFRGIAEKNWRQRSDQPGENLLRAKALLEQAVDIFGPASSQFLTMITLVEVKSYLDEDSRDLLSSIIGRLEQMKSSSALDGNQKMLLTRAYLLNGNNSYLRGDRNDAVKWYREAAAHEPKSFYAYLSAAHAGDSDNRADEAWQTGFRLLEDSGATKKREITTRVTALAWALVAAARLGRADAQERYDLEMAAIQQSSRLGGRVPLFFSPITKQLADFETLRSELHARQSRTTAPASAERPPIGKEGSVPASVPQGNG